jgi:Flp pilus assembly protein TadD
MPEGDARRTGPTGDRERSNAPTTAHDKAGPTKRIKELSAVLGFLVACAVAVVFVHQILTDPTIVEPIAIPEALSQRVGGPKLLTERLVDEIRTIQRTSRTARAIRPVVLEERLIDVQVADVSALSLVRYVRAAIGVPQPRVGGAITAVTDDTVAFRVRFPDDTFTDIHCDTSLVPDGLVALGAYHIVKRLDPFVLAAYEFARGDTAEAAVLLQIAFDRSSDDPWPHNLLGVIHMQGDRLYLAQGEFGIAARSGGNIAAIAYGNWGTALAKQAHCRAAIEKFRRQVQLDPKCTRAYNDWGYLLARLGDHGGAQRQFARASEADSSAPEPYTNYGISLLEQGRYEEAAEQLRTAISHSEGHALAHRSLGIALAHMHDEQGAIDELARAARMDPISAALTDTDIDSLARRNYELASAGKLAPEPGQVQCE